MCASVNVRKFCESLETSPQIRSVPDPKNHGTLEQPSPRTAHALKRMALGPESDIPLLSDWIARTSHLPYLGLVVAWVTSRLVTKESHRVPEAVSQSYVFGETPPTDSA